MTGEIDNNVVIERLPIRTCATAAWREREALIGFFLGDFGQNHHIGNRFRKKYRLWHALIYAVIGCH